MLATEMGVEGVRQAKPRPQRQKSSATGSGLRGADDAHDLAGRRERARAGVILRRLMVGLPAPHRQDRTPLTCRVDGAELSD